MNRVDLLDWIRSELQSQPAVLPLVEPVLASARRTWGGDTVYIRTESRPLSRRTIQRRQAQTTFSQTLSSNNVAPVHAITRP